ncbi:MAG: bifunctional UDP-sugar hydrolase/5'-nucleotidase, partial [Planctomycetota bacterium]
MPMYCQRNQPGIPVLLTCVLAALLMLPGLCAAEDRAVILHWNDFHGQVRPRVRSSGEKQGGIRALAHLVKTTRVEEGKQNVLVLDAGDWSQGTPEGSLTKGRMIVELWNSLDVSAAVVGNHEFDFGEPNLMELVRLARFPVLGANVVDGSGKTRSYLKPFTILKAGGITFGVIGLLTADTPRIVKAEVGRNLIVADAAEICQRTIPEVKKAGAECIVVLSHLGLSHEKALADQVPGIHLIVGGHSHSVEQHWVSSNGTVVVQAGSNGTQVGRQVVTRSGDGFTIRGEILPMAVREESAQASVEQVLVRYRDQVDGVMEETVGELAMPMAAQARGSFPGSSALGSWICDVMVKQTGAEVALHNNGGIRAELPRGPVTVRDLFQVSPFGNQAVLCDMKVSDLREVIATSLEDSSVRLQVSGLDVKWRTSGGGIRLAGLRVQGERLDPDRVYRVATNDYLANGGDSWTQFQRGKISPTGQELFTMTVEEFR